MRRLRSGRPPSPSPPGTTLHRGPAVRGSPQSDLPSWRRRDRSGRESHRSYGGRAQASRFEARDDGLDQCWSVEGGADEARDCRPTCPHRRDRGTRSIDRRADRNQRSPMRGRERRDDERPRVRCGPHEGPIRRWSASRGSRCAVVHQPGVQAGSAGADDGASQTVESGGPLPGPPGSWRRVARASAGSFSAWRRNAARPDAGNQLDQRRDDVRPGRSAPLQLRVPAQKTGLVVLGPHRRPRPNRAGQHDIRG